MRVGERRNAGLPDAHLENSEAARQLLVEQLRYFRPRVVILPFPVGRHPDHRVASELGRDACFLSGLARYGGGVSPTGRTRFCMRSRIARIQSSRRSSST